MTSATSDPSGSGVRLTGAGPAVGLEGISKRFGGVVANDAVDFDVRRGEVHALLGENGAGKTTLMRILYGLTTPDAGTIRIGGEPLAIRSPRDAIAAGIGMVTQHFSLVGPMTVAENVLLGRATGVRLDIAGARRMVREVGERFGFSVEPDATVRDLSIGEQQRVEILKALSRDCQILILDEPTAVLVPQQVESLFATLRRLVAEGLSVVFISHKLQEVRSISDRVTVLRRGRVAGTLAGITNERELAALMVGRPTFGVAAPTESVAEGPPVLEVRGLAAVGTRGLPALRELDLDVRAGEIVGVAGVSGNGQTELVEVLSGMRRVVSGSVRVGDTELAGASPRDVMAAGVGRIPEDRHASLVLDLPVATNLVLERLDEYLSAGGRIDQDRIRAEAVQLIERFSIRARPDDRTGGLSGGNLQKVLLARVLAREPRLIVVSQPTRGLDVGATEYVRSELLARRAAGVAILLVSEDLDELLLLADRIVVIYEGRIVGELDRDEADPERLGLLMAGRSQAA